jgi:hypothetical protein
VVLALDEFQHFFDKTTHKVQHHVADWLKVLADEAQVGLVVTGLPSCLSVIQQNEQLAGRFMAPVRLHRFDWMNEEHRNDFIGILQGMQEALAAFDMPAFGSDEMAFRFYCATGGLIGYLAKLLKQAIWNAIDAKKSSVDLSDLALAFSESIVTDRNQWLALSNPFTRDFAVTPDEALLNKVRQIGTAKLEEPPPSRIRKAAPPKLREVLSTT